MFSSVEVIKDSINSVGQRVTTIVANHPRIIHAELLRHRLFSFSVASSRAIPYAKQMEQVMNDPAMPILWPKAHKGMQGKELVSDEQAEFLAGDTPENHVRETWLRARDNAVETANYLSANGLDLSKQLTNRLLEPWVMTRAVITATNWDNFFLLRDPNKIVTPDDKEYSLPAEDDDILPNGNRIIWGDDIDLEFPAEYNIQDLAIKMKAVINASTPTMLSDKEWHLPFITDDDEKYIANNSRLIEDYNSLNTTLIKISAARCARTSYNKERGKTVEDDLKLSKMLMEGSHWSPFEHQAMAVKTDFIETWDEEDGCNNMSYYDIPKGLEIRKQQGKAPTMWSRNFQNWVQARAILDV